MSYENQPEVEVCIKLLVKFVSALLLIRCPKIFLVWNQGGILCDFRPGNSYRFFLFRGIYSEKFDIKLACFVIFVPISFQYFVRKDNSKPIWIIFEKQERVLAMRLNDCEEKIQYYLTPRNNSELYNIQRNQIKKWR